MIHSKPHPWLRPLYRRVGVLAVCVAWLIFELTIQEQLWLFLACAATGYAVWDFFLSPNYRTAGKSDPPDQAS